jgi:phosphotransferase system IIA component
MTAANYDLSGEVAGDSVGLNDPTAGTYAQKDVGAGIKVSVGGIALTGADAKDYTLTDPSTSAPIGIIDKATITASLVGPVEKTYDGATTATLTGANYQISGEVSGDSVGLNDPGAGTYAQKDVGTGIGVSVTGIALTGADAKDYTLTDPSTSAAVGTITQATLVASLTGSVQKIYDGTATAPLTPANYDLTGVVSGDSVSLNDPTTGTYAGKNVGTGIAVSVSGMMLTGSDAQDYTVNGSASNSIGAITPATLVASLTGTVQKTYDGATTATLTAANYELTGVIGADSVSLNDPSTGTYGSVGPGTGIPVSVAGLALGGADAGDYRVNPAASADIGTISSAASTQIQTQILTTQVVTELVVANTAAAADTTVVSAVSAADAADAAAAPAGSTSTSTRPTSTIGIFPIIGEPPADFIAGDASPVTGAGNGDLWTGSDLEQRCPGPDKKCKR